jgi:hypothetical protein
MGEIIMFYINVLYFVKCRIFCVVWRVLLWRGSLCRHFTVVTKSIMLRAGCSISFFSIWVALIYLKQNISSPKMDRLCSMYGQNIYKILVRKHKETTWEILGV